MSLSLRITSYQRLTPGQQNEFRATAESFTIGRSSDNDWAIPDPQRFLSGVHCRIEQRGNEYYLTDLSTNGVFMNGSEQRIPRDDTVRLEQGDRIRIGDYEFEVDLAGAHEEPGLDSITEDVDLFEPDTDEDPFTAHASPVQPESGDFEKDVNTPLAHLDESQLGHGVDIDSIIDLDDPEAAPEEPVRRESYSPLHDPFTPPEMARPSAPEAETGGEDDDWADIPDDWDAATGTMKAPEAESSDSLFGGEAATEIPDNWDEATGMFKAPEPAAEPPAPQPETPPPAARPERPAAERPAPPARPSAHAGGDAALAAFERGAGLKPGQLEVGDPQALFEQLGKMLQGCTEGLMKTLGGRAHIKSEFRLDQTMIRPVENNPLKFCPTVQDALERLLRQTDQAYMKGVDAVREGFDDINAHQMAVVAGMEAALQGILRKFNPRTLEKKLVSHSVLDTVLPGGKKARYWDIFVLLYDEIASDAEDDFQQLFGKEFSRAYEAQLSRLENNRRE